MKKNNDNLIYFIAGEPSGDLHGSNLIKQIKELGGQSLQFRGLGGALMQQEGLTSIENFRKLSVMGFWEVLKRLFFFLRLKNLVVADILKHKPSKIILIDYPGFNLKVAKIVKEKFNVSVFYYISPQLWAWKEGRINIIKKYVDRLFVVFPFEVSWYKKRGVDVSFFGHPLIDIYKNNTFQKKQNHNKTIGIFPGSRTQEIERHVPVLCKVVRYLKSNDSSVRFVLGLADGVSKNLPSKLGLTNRDCVVNNNSLKAFVLCDVAVVASGTATLECALTKTPCVVIYKTSLFSWLFASFFIKINFVSIVNVLAKKLIVSELLQNKCHYLLICEKINHLLKSKNHKYYIEVDKIIKLLGDGNSYIKTAKYILHSKKC